MSANQRFTRFIFILIDGAPYDVFKELLEDGMLPNIKKHVIDRGSFKKAVSVFPSTSGPAYIPFFMGLFPGRANIPGIRWLSKKDFKHPYHIYNPGIRSYTGLDSNLFSRDLPSQSTWYDYFPSVSNIYHPLTRGCPPSGNRTRLIKIITQPYAHFTHRWNLIDTMISRMLLQDVKKKKHSVMSLFPAVDGNAHASHRKSAAVLKSYRLVDQTVGKMAKILQQQGDYDKTLILISSDHGISDTHTHVDVAAHLDKWGLRCLHYPRLFRRKVKSASMISGNGMSNLYFKNKVNQWGKRLPFEELAQQGVVQRLLELEGVDLIAGESQDGSIIVQKKGGQGKISQQNGKISYQFKQTDPLGYDTTYHNLSMREALIKTYHSAYPDGLVQLWQLFQGERTGDLVLSAKAGYDLRVRYEYPKHHATHGALIAEQMLVPLAISHPLKSEYIRTVDLFPTVLSHLGHSIGESQIDGIALL